MVQAAPELAMEVARSHSESHNYCGIMFLWILH